MMLLTQILILMMEISMINNCFEEKQSFVYSVLVTSLQTDKGRELVKEFEEDARTIISKVASLSYTVECCIA